MNNCSSLNSNCTPKKKISKLIASEALFLKELTPNRRSTSSNNQSENNKQSRIAVGTIEIKSNHSTAILFKIRCNNPTAYRIKVTCGVILPNSSKSISVKLLDLSKGVFSEYHSPTLSPTTTTTTIASQMKYDMFMIQAKDCPESVLADNDVFTSTELSELPSVQEELLQIWKANNNQDSQQNGQNSTIKKISSNNINLVQDYNNDDNNYLKLKFTSREKSPVVIAAATAFPPQTDHRPSITEIFLPVVLNQIPTTTQLKFKDQQSSFSLTQIEQKRNPSIVKPSFFSQSRIQPTSIRLSSRTDTTNMTTSRTNRITYAADKQIVYTQEGGAEQEEEFHHCQQAVAPDYKHAVQVLLHQINESDKELSVIKIEKIKAEAMWNRQQLKLRQEEAMEKIFKPNSVSPSAALLIAFFAFILGYSFFN